MFNYVRLSDGGVPSVSGEMRWSRDHRFDRAGILPAGRLTGRNLFARACARDRRRGPGLPDAAGTRFQRGSDPGTVFHEPYLTSDAGVSTQPPFPT